MAAVFRLSGVWREVLRDAAGKGNETAKAILARYPDKPLARGEHVKTISEWSEDEADVSIFALKLRGLTRVAESGNLPATKDLAAAVAALGRRINARNSIQVPNPIPTAPVTVAAPPKPLTVEEQFNLIPRRNFAEKRKFLRDHATEIKEHIKRNERR